MPPTEDIERLNRLNQFLGSLDLEALCRKYRWDFNIADVKLRAFAVTVELIVRKEPEKRVVVRFPFDTTDAAGEQTTLSYAATLRWLKNFTDIPVPQVFAVVLKSKPGNVINNTYMTMERVPGHNLRPYTGTDFSENSPGLAGYRRVYYKVAHMMCILAICSTFTKIGSLERGPYGSYYVGEYVHPRWTGSSKLAPLYHKFPKSRRGPYETADDYYTALSTFTKFVGLEGVSWIREKDLFLACSLLVDEIGLGKVRGEGFNGGPFWLEHDQLTLDNIFVDDDFRVTGFIEFPGTVVPAPSQNSYPQFFFDPTSGLMNDRKSFIPIFTDTLRQSGLPHLVCVQRSYYLLRSMARKMVEMAIRGSGQIKTLAYVYPTRFSRPFEIQYELGRIAVTNAWFQAYIRRGPDGFYSWERTWPVRNVLSISQVMNVANVPNAAGHAIFANHPNYIGVANVANPQSYYPSYTGSANMPNPTMNYPNYMGSANMPNDPPFVHYPNHTGMANFADPVSLAYVPNAVITQVEVDREPIRVDQWVLDVAHARAITQVASEVRQMETGAYAVQEENKGEEKEDEEEGEEEIEYTGQ